MLNILFFDTETTGLIPEENFQFEKINFYPRLVQLSALLYTEDGVLLETLDFLVKPKDFSIENSEIHGITHEIALKSGHDLDEVFQKFKELCLKANLLVCHNFRFDSGIIKSELFRLKKDDFLSKLSSFCTMTECNTLTKSISLKSLHFELFKEDFENHHNSLTDVKITAKCFFELLKQEKLIKQDNKYYLNNIKNTDLNFELDKDNIKFFNAFTLISETNKCIFLTGKAGTGKTTFLKYLKSHLKKQIITLAFTGVASINAEGQTINSFFQLPFRPFLPDDNSLKKHNIFDFLKYTTNKRDLIKSIDILVIDEVSMVRADIIDAIDKILKIFRNKENLPFGGVQVIFIGDLFQLPPIEGQDWNVIKEFYNSPYFFDSKIIKSQIREDSLVCMELDKVYRQTEIEFIELLNRIRVGKHTEIDIQKLNNLDNKAVDINALLNQNYIILSTTNPKANFFNDTKLQEIENESFIYEGSTNQDFQESMKIAPQRLELKRNAQVMLLKNIGSNYNGQIGKIIDLNENSVEVQFDGQSTTKKIEKAVWSRVEYSYNKEKHIIEEIVKGTYSQLPLKLAWAITVHKSQGLTFSKVIADVSSAFASGQVYVALSRCKSLSGLKFISPIPLNSIKIDSRVIRFSEIKTPETTVISFINEGKADKLYHLFKQLLLKSNIEEAFLKLEEAIKFRNDIFTSSFQMFVKKYLHKYFNYQNIILELNKAIDLLNLDKDYLLNENIEFKNEIVNYKNESQISKLKNDQIFETFAVELKAIKYKMLECEIENNELKNKLEISIHDLNALNNDLVNKNNEILKLKNVNNELISKIEKLNSKWFVKLFGK